MLSVTIQVLLGLINIGSYYAFGAFVNSAALTLYITYVSLARTTPLPSSANADIRSHQSFLGS